MNRTIKVTGFSLKPGLKQKLHDLFSRVGQVDRVYLASDWNSAHIRFGYKNAVQFVLEQEWTFENETLRVRHAVPSKEDGNSPRSTHPASIDVIVPGNLDVYRSTRNHFWMDVPHERCTVVPSGRKKRKRWLDSYHQHQSHPGKTKQTGKKKKHKKEKNAFLESFASVPFGLTCLPEKCPEVQAVFKKDISTGRQIFIKGNETVAALLPWTSTASDLCRLVVEKTGIPEQLIHVTVEGHTLTDEVVRAIVLDSTVCYTVKGLGGADSSDSASQERKDAEDLKEKGNKTASDVMMETEKQPTAKTSKPKKLENEKQTDEKTESSQLTRSARKRLRKKANCKAQESIDQLHGGPGFGEESAKATHAASAAVQEETASDVMMETEKQPTAKTSKPKKLENEKQTDEKTESSQLSKSACKRLRKKANCKAQESIDQLHGGPGFGEESAKATHAASAAVQEEVPWRSDQVSSHLPTNLHDDTIIESRAEVTDSPSCTVERTILSSSSRQEVKCWLQDVCRLTGETLDKLEFDGKVLFAYRNDHQKFAEYTEVPVGIARKIIFLRDNPDCKSAIVKWNVKRVKDFIAGFVVGQNLDKLSENVIDGPAFLSYKDEKELKPEFNLKFNIAFQILVERNTYLVNETNIDNLNEGQDDVGLGGPVEETETAADVVVQPLEKTEESSCLPDKPDKDVTHTTDSNLVVLERDDSFTEYKLFLQDKLFLQPLQEGAGRECKLQVIFHKRKDLNLLEKQFVFFLLCEPDFFKDKKGKDACTKLWKLIKEKVSSVWSNLLPEHIRNQFTFRSNSDRIHYNNSLIEFEDVPVKILTVCEFNQIHKLDQFSTPILLVDKQLWQKAGASYLFRLKIGQVTEPFHFVFQENVRYWLFDSDDFGWGFHQQHVQVIGKFPLCKFTLDADLFSPEQETDGHFKTQDSTDHSAQTSYSADILPDSDVSKEATDGFVEEKDEKEKKTFSEADSEKERFIPFRPFKANSWKYSRGRLRLVETGDNMLSRAVEFKSHAGCAEDVRAGIRAFLYKSLEFVCGCMNARKNGTIYFGIAEEPLHGELCGIEMDQTLFQKYYDEFHRILIQCFPVQFEKVKLCISGPHLVHIGNTTKRVVEIDIEPNYSETKNFVFKFQPKVIFDTYGPPKKSEKDDEGKKQKHVYIKNQDNWTGIFRRDGSATKYVGIDQQCNFETTVLPDLSLKRHQEERSNEITKNNLLSSPEADRLKTFMECCDASAFPILVLPSLSENEKSNLEYFSFLHFIRWSAIFDFDNDSERNGLYSLAKVSNLHFEVHDAVVRDFCDMSVEDRKDCLSFPKKTVWLFTNGKSSGPNAFERYDRKHWKNSYWTYIQNAVAFYKDNSVIPPNRRLVLILVSEEVDDGIIEASQDIKVAFGWDNVLFIFNTKCARQRFIEELSEDVCDHCVVMPWRHVYHVMRQSLNLQSHEKDKYVRASSGAHVPIPLNEWQSWNDLEVLNVYECEEDWKGLSENKKNKKAQEEESKFYNGKPVSWWNFFLTDHAYDQVMVRSCFQDLQLHIEFLSRATEKEDDRIPFITISHMPAAGGSTLGKHILWVLRKKYKCAVIQKITMGTQREITQFWESVEEAQDKVEYLPVILLADKLIDDSSELTDIELCRRIYRHQKELQLSRPLAIMVRCCCTFPDGRSKLRYEFPLTHKLSPEERSWMERKEEHLKKIDVPHHEYFIAWLAMRHEFDQDFLENNITKLLDEDKLFENEVKLIKYISLLTAYFPESEWSIGMPVVCFDVLMRDVTSNQPWEKTLSSIAKLLLVIESYDSLWYVKIANQPLAKAVLETMLKRNKETLCDIVLECLNLLPTMHSLPAFKQMKDLMSKVLIERQFDEGDLTYMSPLIMKIKSMDVEDAVLVLKTGHKILNDEVFNQQLARLYMHENQLDKAREFAELAVCFCPDKRDFKHTLGLVHLKKFNLVMTSQGKKAEEAQSDVSKSIEHLRVAFLALTNFIDAQGKFDDDCLSICFAHCQTIEVVNKVLRFLLDLVSVSDQSKLGRYLTESDYLNFPLFKDLQDQETRTLKGLLDHGIKTLRFLFYLSHSHDYGLEGDSYQVNKDRRVIRSVSEMCIKELNILSRNIEKLNLKTKFYSETPDIPREDSALRYHNVQLKGCFFESVFFELYPMGKQRKRKLEDLHRIEEDLKNIEEKTFRDMDNLMTVRLAIQIAEKKTYKPFTDTAYRSQNYKMCDKIIRSGKKSDALRARAHLYQVLLSWPEEYWAGFNKDEFQRSFQAKSQPLMHKKEPLLPKVHFYVTDSQEIKSCFCHWTEKENFDLRTFTGDYKVKKNSSGEQSSSIDMHWKCAAGELTLTIWKIRGEKVFRPEKVEFYLGFSLHGPVAFIQSVLPNNLREQDHTKD